MNELKQLYQAMEILKSQGISVESIEEDIRKKEDSFIREQISSRIKPIVEEIMNLLKGKLSICIEGDSFSAVTIKGQYNDRPISIEPKSIEVTKVTQEDVVSLSSKGKDTMTTTMNYVSPNSLSSENFANKTLKISYSKEEHKKGKKPAKRDKIKVTIDGKVFCESVVSETFTDVIRTIGKEVGFKRIYDLAILADGDFIVTKERNGTEHARYNYLADGWYVNTHSGTEKKKEILEDISRRLGLRGRMRIDLI